MNLAAKLNIAVLGITHLNKGGSTGDPAQRIVGSIAFTALARIVMVAAKYTREDGESGRLLVRAKANIGPDDGGFEYHIGQTEVCNGIPASRIEWSNSVKGTARDLLAEPDPQDEGTKRSAVAEAEEFLIEVLSDGPAPTKNVERQAKDAGISWAAVKRASEALKIKKRPVDKVWYWSKPDHPTHVSQTSGPEKVEQLGKVEQVEQLERVRNEFGSAPSAPKGAAADDSEVF